MHSVNEAKLKAKKLRQALEKLDRPISTSESLELISVIQGHKDWNTFNGSLKNKNNLLPIPSGWKPSGDNGSGYYFGTSKTEAFQQLPVACIQSKLDTIDTDAKGFATLMQSIDATNYRGSRLQLTANIKAIDCTGLVTIWMRVDGSEKNNSLAFDNMEERSHNGVLTKTSDWESRAIVLDVPDSAESVHYGFYLKRSGTALAAGFALETVSTNVEVTSHTRNLSDKPNNLNFDQDDSATVF